MSLDSKRPAATDVAVLGAQRQQFSAISARGAPPVSELEFR